MKTLLIILKSIKDSKMNVEIKHPTGEKYYREFTDKELLQFLFDAEAVCEHKGYDFKFVIPENIKSMCAAWMGSLTEQHNK